MQFWLRNEFSLTFLDLLLREPSLMSPMSHLDRELRTIAGQVARLLQ